MSTIHFTINGLACETEAGTNVLQAALQHGIEIPNLCKDQRMEAFGACMLCRVEINGARGNPLACAWNSCFRNILATALLPVA